jgi:hypothetical protein
MVTLVMTPGMTPTQPELRSAVRDFRSDALREVPAEATVARAKLPNGYAIEALLPWAMLGVTPEAGHQVGCQLLLRDWDEAGPARLRRGSVEYNAGP